MQNQFKNAIMMGLGYIGLPTAALIAKNKIQVHGVDVQKKLAEYKKKLPALVNPF